MQVDCLAVSDLAWSPDNVHFVSCATDSTICIWNVNEYSKSIHADPVSGN